MPRQKLKRLIAGALCGAMLLALPACQEDPEGSIVANKDMDKLISQGAESGGEPGGRGGTHRGCEEDGDLQDHS
jgi:hypothetical protein